MVKTLGRAYDNTIVINKPDISSHHAKISFLGNGNFLVEDTNSANGVFVNGYRVEKANVTLRDEVRLSESTVLNLASLFDIRPQNAPAKQGSKDFTNEFDGLRQIWEDYQTIRLKINKRYQTSSTIARSLLSLAPLAIWVIFKAAYLDQFKKTEPEFYSDWQGSFIYFSVIGGAIGNLVGGLMIPSPQEKLTALDEEFRVRYVCPNPSCRTQLGSVPWQSYYNQGKCFRCQAKYSDEAVD